MILKRTWSAMVRGISHAGAPHTTESAAADALTPLQGVKNQ